MKKIIKFLILLYMKGFKINKSKRSKARIKIFYKIDYSIIEL